MPFVPVSYAHAHFGNGTPALRHLDARRIGPAGFRIPSGRFGFSRRRPRSLKDGVRPVGRKKTRSGRPRREESDVRLFPTVRNRRFPFRSVPRRFVRRVREHRGRGDSRPERRRFVRGMARSARRTVRTDRDRPHRKNRRPGPAGFLGRPPSVTPVFRNPFFFVEKAPDGL